MFVKIGSERDRGACVKAERKGDTKREWESERKRDREER